MGRNSGILWAMLQSSLVAGAIFLFFVLSYGDLYSSYRFLYSAFAVVSTFGIITLCLLPSTPPVNLDESLQDPLFDENTDELDVSASVDISPTRDWREEFRVFTACLSAATALNGGSEKIIAYVVFTMGAGQISGGLLFGVFPRSNKLNRSQIVILGMILHITAFFLCFLNLPMEAPLHKTSATGYIEPSVFIAIVTGYFLGLADSCWNTQIYTLNWCGIQGRIIVCFCPFQSLAACASFYYSSILLLHWQLLMLCLGAASAAVCFFVVALKAEEQVEVD
ncbi:hypothetical protein COOONC_07115 [Cooperia oncophora]